MHKVRNLRFKTVPRPFKILPLNFPFFMQNELVLPLMQSTIQPVLRLCLHGN
jgi:hypothetical protein